MEAFHKAGNVYIRGTTLPIEREVRQILLAERHTSVAQENKAVRNAKKVSKTEIAKPPPIYQRPLQLIGTLVLLSAIVLAGVKLFNWYNKKIKI